MISQLMLQDVTSQDYGIQYPSSSGSSIKKLEMGVICGDPFSIWMRQRPGKEGFYFLQNLLSLLEIDLSSVCPRFETKNETSLMEIEEISEEAILAEMVEHDFIVQMPPIRKYTVRLKVKSIKEATPHVVEPEGV